ncbi:hypothetical protein AB3N02_21920 [Priestia aryabhattai]|uniref:hypothetical protein n=1 Tax=Priestia aryabhattai TaxID=412384 RepID=UPI00399F3F56
MNLADWISVTGISLVGLVLVVGGLWFSIGTFIATYKDSIYTGSYKYSTRILCAFTLGLTIFLVGQFTNLVQGYIKIQEDSARLQEDYNQLRKAQEELSEVQEEIENLRN